MDHALKPLSQLQYKKQHASCKAASYNRALLHLPDNMQKILQDLHKSCRPLANRRLVEVFAVDSRILEIRRRLRRP